MSDPQATPPSKADHLVTREIADETVIVPVRRGAVDIDAVYVLNATGAWLWAHIDGKRTTADLVDVLLEKFQIDRATAESDVEEFLHSLRETRLTGLTADS